MSLKKRNKFLLIVNIIAVLALILSVIPFTLVSGEKAEEPVWSIIQSPNANISNQIKNDGGTVGDASNYSTWSFPGWVKPGIMSITDSGTLMSVVKDDINNISLIPNQNGKNMPAFYEFDFTLFSDSGDYTQKDKPLVLALSPWSIAKVDSTTKIVSKSQHGIGFKIFQDGTLELYQVGPNSWGNKVKSISDFKLDEKHHFVIAQTSYVEKVRTMAVYIDNNKLYEYTVAAADDTNTDKTLAKENLNIGVAMTGGWNLQDAKVLVDLTPKTTKEELSSLSAEYKSYYDSTTATKEAKETLKNAIDDAVKASESNNGTLDLVAILNTLKSAKIEYDKNIIKPLDKDSLTNEINTAKSVLKDYKETDYGYADLNKLITDAEELLKKSDATNAEGEKMESDLKESVAQIIALNTPLDKTKLKASIDAAEAAIIGFNKDNSIGYETLTSLIAEAKELFNKNEGTNESQGLEMRTRLDEKTEEFVLYNKRIDKEALQKIISSAEEIIKNFNNKAKGYDTFKATINEAKTLLNDNTAIEAQGIEMQSKLNEAINTFERNNNIEPKWAIIQSKGRKNIYNQILTDGGKAPDEDDYTTWSCNQWKQPSIGETNTSGTELRVVKDDINIQSVLKNSNSVSPWFEFDFTYLSTDNNKSLKNVVIGIHPEPIDADNGKTTSLLGDGIGFEINESGVVNMFAPSKQEKILTDFQRDVVHRFIIAQTSETENTRTITVYIDYKKVNEFTLTKSVDSYYDTIVNNQYISLAMNGGWNIQYATVKVDLTPTTVLEELKSLIAECRNISKTYFAKNTDKIAFNSAISNAELAINGGDLISSISELKVAKSVFLGVATQPLDKESLQNVINYAKGILKKIDKNAKGRSSLEAKIKEAEKLLTVSTATWDDGNKMENEIAELLEPFDSDYYDDDEEPEYQDDDNNNDEGSESHNDNPKYQDDNNAEDSTDYNEDSEQQDNYSDVYDDYDENYESSDDEYDSGYDDGYNSGYNDCYDEVYGGADGELKSALIKVDGQLKNQAIIFTVVNGVFAFISLVSVILTIIFFIKQRKASKLSKIIEKE